MTRQRAAIEAVLQECARDWAPKSLEEWQDALATMVLDTRAADEAKGRGAR